MERLEQEKQGGKETLVGNKYENHAWFVGYAPADNPRVAVAVIVEHGGHGGSSAGPLARRVIAAALTGNASPRWPNRNEAFYFQYKPQPSSVANWPLNGFLSAERL